MLHQLVQCKKRLPLTHFENDYDIQATIHADIENKTNEEIKSTPKTKEASYSRPINPKTHPDESKEQRNQLARTVQYHKCTTLTCLRKVRGRHLCKRGAPFLRALYAWVKENREWGPKRLCEYLNNWNPAILTCLRCNHDIKLLLNGSGTHALTFYITIYATKKQTQSSNVSALLAKTIAFHLEHGKQETDAQRLNKLLVQRCTNSLSRDCEFSAPEIISYLMGWGDRFESHYYVMIYCEAAVKVLSNTFPSLSTEDVYGPQVPTRVRHIRWFNFLTC